MADLPMLAIYQRPPLVALIARARGCPPKQATFADMAAAKRLLAEELAPFATATLVDPNFAYPAAIAALPAHAGLIVTLEEHRVRETEGGAAVRRHCGLERRSHQGDRRRRREAADLGFVRMRRRTWWRTSRNSCARSDATARCTTSRSCSKAAGLIRWPAPRLIKMQAVVASAAEFAHPDYAVDLLKLELPLPAAALPADDRAGEARLAEAFAALGLAAGALPWVLLSGGAGKDTFRRLVRAA